MQIIHNLNQYLNINSFQMNFLCKLIQSVLGFQYEIISRIRVKDC